MLCIRRFCFVMSLMIVVSAAQLTDLEHALNCFIDVPEGIEKLCSDLDVSRTDIRFLMLAWTMKAEKQGYITHEEWTRGLKALRSEESPSPARERGQDAIKFYRFLCLRLSLFFNRGKTGEHRHRDYMSTPRYRLGIYIPTPISSRAVDEQDLEGIVDVFHRPEGIELLCSDLDVSRTDIRFLMLAWKMKAEKQGYFTQEEWTRGLVALGVVTLDKLKKALPELEKEVRKQSNFADFYAYAFTYSLTEEKQESIDIETISQLLDTVMGSTFRPQVDYFVDYLKIQNDYKVINMDQWMGFYRFCNEISFPDMSEYKPELAWPLVLDNFVEWIPSRDITELESAINSLIEVYHKYSNTSSNLIDPQGIELLCSDLDVSRTDIRLLMLAWADTIDKLKKALPALEKEVRRPSNFADFYAYAFTYSLTEEEQKSVDIETICQLLDNVMGSTFRPQVDYFLDYLKIQNDYEVIYMDQWMGFYRFCNEISFPGMSEYNPGLAWPLLLNNFVEWIREKQA
ncbi:hypothetical protein YC2023_096996 [Brassica napus]